MDAVHIPFRGSRPGADDLTTDRSCDRGWWIAAMAAVWVAWFPVETHPLSGPAVAAGLTALVVWRLEHGAADGGRDALRGLVPVVLVLAVSGAGGRDPSRAVAQLALVVAVVGAFWTARHARPPRWAPTAVAAAIAGLAAWAVWQQLVGFEELTAELPDLAGAQHEYLQARIAAGRPFASQLFPSHLAVLLATALPLLVGSAGTTGSRAWRWPLAALVAVGLLLTRSPIGIGLAVLAVALPAAVLRSRRLAIAAVSLMVLATVVVVGKRPDVLRLEPVALRVDNWRTAVAVWRQAPAAGAGFGGFGQAAQSVDLELGNRPAHAHSVVAEGLAELGPVGVAGAIALLASVAWVAWRLRHRDPWLAASVMVVPIHNLFDFSWWVSGVALPWAVLAGWAVGRLRPERSATRAPRRDPLRIAVTVAGTVAFALTVLHATSRWIEWSVDPTAPALEREATYERAWRLAPWRTRPALHAALAAVESGDRSAVERAARSLDRVELLRPFSADVAAVRARLEQARGDEAAAAAAAWEADRRRVVTGRADRPVVRDRPGAGQGGPGG